MPTTFIHVAHPVLPGACMSRTIRKIAHWVHRELLLHPEENNPRKENLHGYDDHSHSFLYMYKMKGWKEQLGSGSLRPHVKRGFARKRRHQKIEME